MSVVAEERILVVPTSVFRKLGYFQGFSREIDRYWPRIVDGDHVEYRARGEMETDPSFKQLIPYVLFRWTDASGTPHLFEYQRGTGMGERRLHAKRSVGIGGHISSIDAGTVPILSSPREKMGLSPLRNKTPHVYREGMRRELEEEVIIDTAYNETIVGLINDDETPVGQVHLGMVHLFDVESPNIRPRETDVLDARFSPVSDILTRTDQFESWSAITVGALFG
ncbi:MAG TPA: phosphoesterase [Lacipirellulaceae bacterium]|nr:phosphoesterase [Lacipirellulaceae bacterium]